MIESALWHDVQPPPPGSPRTKASLWSSGFRRNLRPMKVKVRTVEGTWSNGTLRCQEAHEDAPVHVDTVVGKFLVHVEDVKGVSHLNPGLMSHIASAHLHPAILYGQVVCVIKDRLHCAVTKILVRVGNMQGNYPVYLVRNSGKEVLNVCLDACPGKGLS